MFLANAFSAAESRARSNRGAYPAVRAMLIELLAEQRHTAAVKRAVSSAVVESSDLDFSIAAMTATTATESPAGARQRREYAARGSKQARYATRSAQVSR